MQAYSRLYERTSLARHLRVKISAHPRSGAGTPWVFSSFTNYLTAPINQWGAIPAKVFVMPSSVVYCCPHRLSRYTLVDLEVVEAVVLDAGGEEEEQEGRGLCVSIAALLLSIPALIGNDSQRCHVNL